MSATPDEFEWIARVLRPLARNAPEAFDLADDAASIPGRPGCDLIVTKDAIVEGVHFVAGDPPELVARKLLRVNLSDLAAKGAEPYGYFLAVAWPARFGWGEREAFARGLEADQAHYALKLFGGDTVSTPGPLTASVTMLGWAPAGRMVLRSAAQPGDRVLVTGTIGDGRLGLDVAKGLGVGLSYADEAWLVERYRLPQPRLSVRNALSSLAHAAADVSDGLLADVGHIAEASGAGARIDLDRLPLSGPASRWLARASDAVAARVALATGGDDYEIVCTAPAERAGELAAACRALDLPLTEVGEVTPEPGLHVLAGGREIEVSRTGWRHG
ncbi:MAG TPA: thiamine-phosphate kinase [Caulobacteraceae bacterium]|nr:thiamine-phosphate kinase [Caulobacteraceae bacterium]